jgi:hypothetical protein
LFFGFVLFFSPWVFGFKFYTFILIPEDGHMSGYYAAIVNIYGMSLLVFSFDNRAITFSSVMSLSSLH